METAVERPPVWKYQRQFDYGEGVSTLEHRPNLLTDPEPKLLDDEQVREFLANGCLALQPALPEEFHRRTFERFVELIGEDNDHNPGNNLLPVVPELQLVFDDPVVKGALTSVLGEGYMMHPHRVLHDNPPGSDAQVWSCPALADDRPLCGGGGAAPSPGERRVIAREAQPAARRRPGGRDPLS